MARKTKEMAEITRKEILQAALEIFCEKNYSDVTIVEIAKKASLTKGAIYWHFKNKKDLLAQLLNEVFTNSQQNIIEVFEKPESILEMRSYFKETLLKPLSDKKYKRMHKLLSRRQEWPESIQKQADKLIRNTMACEEKKLETLLVKAKENNKISQQVDPAEIATLIAYTFYGLFILQVAEMLPKEFTKSMDFLFDSITRELEYSK